MRACHWSPRDGLWLAFEKSWKDTMTKWFVTIGLLLVSFLCCQSASSQSWKDLLKTADSLSEMQDQDSARVIGKLALEKAEGEFGTEDTTVALVLHHLGVYTLRKYFIRRYDETESFLKRALAIREKVYSEEHPAVAATLRCLAGLYSKHHIWAKAEPLFNRSLAIREKIFGPDHPETAESLRSLGIFYTKQADYAQAEPFFKRSLTAMESAFGPGHLEVASPLEWLGSNSWSQGRYAQAEASFKRALAIREKAYGPDHPDLAGTLNSLGGVYMDQGMYAQAEPLYKRSLVISKGALGPDHPDVAKSLANLGSICVHRGKYTEAEELFRQSLAVSERALGPHHPDVATSLISLGSIYAGQGNYAEAESSFKRSLKILSDIVGSHHPWAAQSLNSLANLYVNRGEYVQAESLCERSLAVMEEAVGSDHPYVATSLTTLGNIYISQGKYAQAESCLEQALTINEKILGPDHPDVAESLELMSELYRFQGKRREAVWLAERACGIRLKNFAENGIVLSEKDALTYSRFMRESVHNYLTCYSELGHMDDSTTEDAADIVFSGKGEVSDEMFERQKALVKETDSTTLALAESLRLAKFQLSKLFVQGSGEDVERYRKTVDSLGRLANELEADLSRHSASFREQQDRSNISAARLASVLPEKSVLVEYLKYNYHQREPDTIIPRYLAVVVASDEEPAIINLGDASEVDSLVDRYRKHMLRVSAFGKLLKEDQEAYEEISTELYDRVWLSVADYVADKGLVLIAPDGALNMVSFAGLMDAGGRYLVERSTIHHLTCGRDLIRLKDEAKPASGLFAVGDPDYEASVSARISGLAIPDDTIPEVAYYATRNVRSGCQELKETLLSPLPGTRNEVERVVASWQESTDESANIYFGPAASEERFKAEAPGSRVIHLATHGYFLGGQCRPDLSTRGFGPDIGFAGENPLLLSGLFFAGANLHGQGTDSAGAEDGVLTAYEVSAMDLEGTDLVVLSACETALGKVEEGEGVYGLRRAFQMAGARTVISALWPVSDKLTAEMLSELYEKTDESIPETMRRIQLEKISELRSQDEVDHPLNWAGFIILGDWK